MGSGRDFDEVQGAIRAKYGWQTTLFALVAGLATRRKGLTYRDTVVIVTPQPQHFDREDAHHG